MRPRRSRSTNGCLSARPERWRLSKAGLSKSSSGPPSPIRARSLLSGYRQRTNRTRTRADYLDSLVSFWLVLVCVGLVAVVALPAVGFAHSALVGALALCGVIAALVGAVVIHHYVTLPSDIERLVMRDRQLDDQSVNAECRQVLPNVYRCKRTREFADGAFVDELVCVRIQAVTVHYLDVRKCGIPGRGLTWFP